MSIKAIQNDLESVSPATRKVIVLASNLPEDGVDNVKEMAKALLDRSIENTASDDEEDEEDENIAVDESVDPFSLSAVKRGAGHFLYVLEGVAHTAYEGRGKTTLVNEFKQYFVDNVPPLPVLGLLLFYCHDFYL